jgi:hypothetical protein
VAQKSVNRIRFDHHFNVNVELCPSTGKTLSQRCDIFENMEELISNKILKAVSNTEIFVVFSCSFDSNVD